MSLGVNVYLSSVEFTGTNIHWMYGCLSFVQEVLVRKS